MSEGTFLFILIVVIFLALALIITLLSALLKTRKQLRRYQSIIDLEAEQEKVKGETEQMRQLIEQDKRQRETLEQERAQIRQSITQLRSLVSDLEDELEMQSYGIYRPKYNFETSARYQVEIDQIRNRQKQMVRDKKAILSKQEWLVEGSKAKGQQMLARQTHLMLRAFNGECDALIMKVKHNNLDRVQKQIVSLYDAINKLGASHTLSINPQYLELKIQELRLVQEFEVKKEAEREEQRQIREQMREEQRVQREIEKAQRDAEREEKRYQEALEKARQEMAMATGAKHEKLQSEIERLNQLLQEALENKERAKSLAEMTRSGHVYVISNIGSFGEDIYKIGLTRRLEPLDRVRELGDASVPFPFDVHAMIYSEDAPTLESKLHQTFDLRRVNRVNPRKEFFNVSLKEIEEVVLADKGQIKFTLAAEADEFRQTQTLIAEEQPTQPVHTVECPNCGERIPSNRKFCTVCGSAMAATKPATTADIIACPHCGAEIPSDKKFCTVCGGAIQEKAPAALAA